METILVAVDMAKLENPDTDIRYDLADKLEIYTHNEIFDNGSEYISDTAIGIWLGTTSAKENYGRILEFFEEHMVAGNDLASTAMIYISDQDFAPFEECTLVYDGEKTITDKEVRRRNRVHKAGKIILQIAEMLMEEDKETIEAFAAKVNELPDIREQWQSYTEILLNQRYVYECSMDLKFDDFWDKLSDMRKIKEKDLPIRKEDFYSGEDLYDWCVMIDEKWEAKEFCMAMFKLRNEVYALFPCRLDQLGELEEVAREVGVRITDIMGI